MDTTAKNDELIELCKKLRFSQRIVFSDEGNLNTPSNIWTTGQDTFGTRKPDGMWYSFGAAWIRFLTNNFRDYGDSWEKKRLAGYTHVYKLSLNRKKIYSIQTLEQFDEFCGKYENKNHRAVRWLDLANDGWSGIEIQYLSDRDDVFWYDGWDCSSGCIWDRSAVKKIECLAAWEYLWTRK